MFQEEILHTCGSSSSETDNVSSIRIREMSRGSRLKEALTILRVDLSVYISLLHDCTSERALSKGKLLHAHITQTGKLPYTYLQNALVNMYAKCGSLPEAHRVFDQIARRTLVSWTVMIGAYNRHGYAEAALTLFQQMQRSGVHANHFTFTTVLPSCGHLALLEHGRQIHTQIIASGFQSDVVVVNALIDMYAKCGNIENARSLFEKMADPNVVSWTTMIGGYAKNGHAEEALKYFSQMQKAGVIPNSNTFVAALSSCANLATLEQGMQIHGKAIKIGYVYDLFVSNALVDMYAKCGIIKIARSVFDKISQRDVVSWNVMIAGYGYNGHVDEALKLFLEMPEKDAISWNAMIAAYAKNGNAQEALKLFYDMQLAGVERTLNTFVSVLSACTNAAVLKEGMTIHEEIIKNGLQSNVYVGTALIEMYAKCSSIILARNIFDNLHQRSVVSWTAMIAAYAQNGQAEEALQLFRQMHLASVKPNLKTFTSVLTACANLAALEQGKEIHKEIIRNRFKSDVFLGSALVDMYAKCGSLEHARDEFYKICYPNVVSWNAMIAGYAMHGHGKEALQLFEQMQLSGMKPDNVTFISVLSACCHGGLVKEGCQYFDSMNQYYHITPTREHYGCMIDLLGRAGLLYEAEELINKMPIKPDTSMWGCLLAACRTHNNIELGEYVAGRILDLDPKNTTPYVLLSNMYAEDGRWDGTEEMRKMMKDRGVKKKPGCSWIEINK